jgi:hypothetical protein
LTQRLERLKEEVHTESRISKALSVRS